MSPPSSKSKHSESGVARLCGSGTSGFLELMIFHPIDTVAKRLMSNQTRLFVSGQPFNVGLANTNKVIFKDAANAAFLKKYASLFPGLGFAAGYKIMQRVYKFGGQPFVNEYLNRNFKGSFNGVFGEKTGKTMMHATAGSLVGIGEIALLPLDVLKIKRQTNPEAFRGRGVMKIVADEGMGLYRGALWTAGRNAPGSFALFGGSAFVKEWIFGLEDYSKATFFQNFCASIGGSVASITVAAPLDVVKTRIQNRNFDNPEGGVSIIKKMVRNEGFGAFFKGLLPKILVVGPKLVFSFTIAQQLIPLFHRKFEELGITQVGNVVAVKQA
ncbi:mitochondrial carrier domain-containing protein [Lobosporangium transversale]|uniref:Mitochondrial carrier domain-containing protein n=1 Tax=Lobosporangium transversale TaxID=64571 RepID=A0A1Y2GDM4_9FUNG|nr:mitochondrial carrier domain-containing protein [Lobosporangium transversale]ORZ07954.1 mitochondrial carrier domain-containing protein [Lobosporangium transversale]|eukprot:XP_021878188.1 mitochondrial carrier domain-containing protein [Lobosporangium transversale]